MGVGVFSIVVKVPPNPTLEEYQGFTTIEKKAHRMAGSRGTRRSACSGGSTRPSGTQAARLTRRSPRIKGRFVKACDLEEYHRRVAAGEDPQSITFDKK